METKYEILEADLGRGVLDALSLRFCNSHRRTVASISLAQGKRCKRHLPSVRCREASHEWSLRRCRPR